MTHKKTKIVATLGPASASDATLSAMIRAGLNIARFNFSHGTHKEHEVQLAAVRKASKKVGIPVAIMQDLSGPKIRIGDFYKDRVMLKKGQPFTLTTARCIGDEHRVYINYPTLPREVKPGAMILLDDGKKRLQVKSIKGNEVHCRVIVGGETKGRRGVNLPGTTLSVSSLTLKDRKDLEFGIRHGVDFIALSFVRSVKDIEELRSILKKRKCSALIISKIETQEATDNIEAVIDASDAVMVARGDLAIEIPAENVPLLQKKIVALCNASGKPVIVATQMLESMIHAPVPTRAEVSDIANSVLDGTDAVMLSEETALGEFPVEAIEVMSRVAMHTEEESYLYDPVMVGAPRGNRVVNSVSEAVVDCAAKVDARAIVALTTSGFTARMIARFRPQQAVFAMTSNEAVYRQLVLSFGCVPLLVPKITTLSKLVEVVRITMRKEIQSRRGDRVVVSAGIPFGTIGGTNLLFVEEL